MATNRAVHISAEIEEIKWLKPGSILDVGIGFGIMGAVFRMATDIRKSEVNPELFHDWQTKIDGIEVFEWYRNPLWQVYSNVYIGDAFEVIDTLEKYDVIYLGDVLEHFEKERGHALIEKLLQHTNQWLQIATPSPAPVQKAILDNPYEEHKSSWSEDDFKKYNYELVGNFGDYSGNMLCVRLKQ